MNSNLITEMRTSVTGYNKHLKSRVNSMTINQLLAHVHPFDREEYARRLYREGYITEEGYKAVKARMKEKSKETQK